MVNGKSLSRILLTAGIISTFSFANAQRSKAEIDSLIEKSNETINENHKKSLELLDSAIKFSEAVNYKKGVAKAYHNKGLIYMMREKDASSAEKYYFKALEINEAEKDSSQVALNLWCIGQNNLENLKKYDEAEKYFLEAVKINEALKRFSNVSSEYQMLGRVKNRQKKPDEAEKYYLKSIEVCERIRDFPCLIESNKITAQHFAQKKDNARAVEHFLKAIKISEEIQDSSKISTSYQSFISYLLFNEKYIEALEFLKKDSLINSEILSRKSENYSHFNAKNRLSKTLINLGDIYLEQKEYKKAEEHFLKAFEYSRDIGNKFREQDCYTGLIEAYRELEDYQKMSEYYDKRLELLKEPFNPIILKPEKKK